MAALVEHRTFLHSVLDRQAQRRRAIDPLYPFPVAPFVSPVSPPNATLDDDLFKPGESSKSNVVNYVPEEETIRNDYEEWYGQSGNYGSNYILGAGEGEVCEEYPALRKLMELKAELIGNTSHPPVLLPLQSAEPTDIQSRLQPVRFDVILITPPLSMSWDEILSLPIRNISSDPGFVFLWCGRGDQEGLEKGRECFAKWGYRRAEDIVWVKTNRRKEPTQRQREGEDADMHVDQESVNEEVADNEISPGAGLGGLFASQKEHCLMGIRGTVRRSVDTRFVHCNVDTDVLVWEDPGDPDSPRYPPYLYTLIENFCLGTRRLHLFGPSQTPRAGWVTASQSSLAHYTANSDGTSSSTPEQALSLPAPAQLFDPAIYHSLLPEKSEGRHVLPLHPEIEVLRPKSPTRKGRGGNPPTGPGHSGPAGRPAVSQNSFRPQGRFMPQMQQESGSFAYSQGGYLPNMGPMGMPAMMPMQMQVPMQMQMQMGWNSGYGQAGMPYQQMPYGMPGGGWDPSMMHMGMGYDGTGGGVDPQMMAMMVQAQQQAWQAQGGQGGYGAWQ